MIPEFLKSRIEMRFGKSIRYSKDCEALAASISKHCGEKISATTLMRIFGLMKSSTKPRLYTLDLIAQYSGFENWDAAINDNLLSDNSYFDTIDKIVVNSLKKNQIIHIRYAPDRILTLEYQGDMNFLVREAQNSKLHPGDLVQILRIECLFPLVCEHVIREGKDLGKFIGGKEGGIQNISVEE
jgi:hypothetical protein